MSYRSWGIHVSDGDQRHYSTRGKRTVYLVYSHGLLTTDLITDIKLSMTGKSNRKRTCLLLEGLTSTVGIFIYDRNSIFKRSSGNGV